MHRFIRSNKQNKTRIYVCNYDWPIEEKLKGEAIVVRINSLNDIENIAKNIDTTTKVNAYVYRNDYASLETIDVKPEWKDTPVVLYINRLGQFRNVFHKINLLKQLNVIVIFTGPASQACRDAQILASLGIHTGIDLTPDYELGEPVLDLITYTFYSPMPHAHIEPFATMEKYYDGETYVSPAIASFINPDRYLHIDKEQKVAFSPAALKDGKVLATKYPDLTIEEIEEGANEELCKWQEFFVDSHRCTFCPAFRVCTGYFCRPDGSTPEECQNVMSELLDSIEFEKTKSHKIKKEQCQL